ncbi:MAG: sarcosine oxidase subunit alpha family protein [Bauldia sp.]|nr:sarcosine oxidase subunit alpha family protein [Bauldia sp.]
MSLGINRLAKGGLIDRTKRIGFSFDGRQLAGYEGDTLASALVANHVKLVGRSFKYHRPRGLLGAGAEEPNGLVALGAGARTEANTKATLVELFEGLEATSQNRFPSLRLDLQAMNGLLSPFFAAGFYYKTFMWPRGFWERLYEPAIRRAAGLGRASTAPDPDRYEKANAFCDVLVIGGGPAGLIAAHDLGRGGARVILAEQDFVLGGRLLAERLTVGDAPGAAWAREVERELAAMPNVTILRRTAVFAAYDQGGFAAVESAAPDAGEGVARQTLWRIAARASILATGAVERPIVFGGNDRPGVMLASAVRSYVNRFGATPGWSVAILASSDDGWSTAADLGAAGVPVVAVIDRREEVGEAVKALAPRGTRLILGGEVVGSQMRRLALSAIDVLAKDGTRTRINADCLAMAGGWTPAAGLATHLGGKMHWSEKVGAPVATEAAPGMFIAGAAAGAFALRAALAGGAGAAREAATLLGLKAVAPEVPVASDEFGAAVPIRLPARKSRGPAFVDFQNDVTAKDIKLAVQEGFASPEHLKRYTTLGMATDQGRTSGVNGLALLAEATGHAMADLAPTTARPPDSPVAIGALAGPRRGRAFRSIRRISSHCWAEENGAVFGEAGLWLRPRWYARPGEADWLTTVTREVNAVRGAVGVCDVSTLGKIDVQGPDAGAFLDRVYVNTFSTLPAGKARYGVMLREDGIVFDDGVTARLGEDRYLVSTTTANAVRVMQHLEYCHQVLWPGLDVQMTSVTEAWGQYAIAGPRSREVAGALFGGGLDVSDAAFPALTAREVDLDGLGARLFRVSFSGELAYEVAVPANFGWQLFERILRAGEPFGIAPYGTEALGVLRIERGHVAGNEINGQTTAGDLGLGRMMSAKKDFVGKTLAQRPGLVAADRPVLVGVRPVEAQERISGGAHFLDMGARPSLENDLGHVTSVAFSPSLGAWIGLGLLRRGRERTGETVRAYDPVRGRDTAVKVVSPIFIPERGG